MEITKEKFERYIKVQRSGVTNMFMVSNVTSLTGLEKEEVLYIMKHYEELEKKYEEEEDEDLMECIRCEDKVREGDLINGLCSDCISDEEEKEEDEKENLTAKGDRLIAKEDLKDSLSEIIQRIEEAEESISDAESVAMKLGGEYDRVVVGQLQGYTEGSFKEEKNRIANFIKAIDEGEFEEEEAE